MNKIKVGDNVCSLVVNTLIGRVSRIINDEFMTVCVYTVQGVKFLLAEMKYWRKIDIEGEKTDDNFKK